jgi:hypothetical protein
MRGTKNPQKAQLFHKRLPEVFSDLKPIISKCFPAKVCTLLASSVQYMVGTGGDDEPDVLDDFVQYI